MRFFAHDGKSTHGPSGIDELLKLPGFDGDTLVCPVGSNDTADWKPALTYPPFKKALLDAASVVMAAPAPAAPPAPLPALPAMLPPMPSIPAMPAIVAMAPALPPAPMPVPAPFPLPLPAAPPPAPVARAAAPAAAPTAPCPRCAHGNLEEARFCNLCGARMSGALEDLSSSFPATALPSSAEPAPYDAFAALDPMISYPSVPASASKTPAPAPRASSGKMGQLSAYEEPLPPLPEPQVVYPSASASLAPDPVPEAPPFWKRPAVLAAFASAALIAGGAGYVLMSKRAPVLTAELAPSAPASMPEPPAAPAPPLYSTPPAASSLPPTVATPRAPAPTAKAKAKAKAKHEAKALTHAPKRARKPRPARAPKPEPAVVEGDGAGDTFIESRAPDPEPKPKKSKGKRAAKAAAADGKDPLLEALLSDATQGSAEPAGEPAAKPAEKAPPMIGQRPSAKPGQFSLPGLQRPVSASEAAATRAPQARAPRPAADAPPEQAAPDAAAALSEPGKPAPPPPGIENEPAKSAEGDQLALVQVHEQFDFCAQLLAQGAFGDHYDTCLCKDAREAAPYRGRRGFYATAKKKEANAGRLESTAKILSSKIDAGVASVKARWKSSTSDKGRDVSQTWKLEDGLWCQAP